MTIDPYRTLGIGYATQRRTDPEVYAHITRALEDCQRVINVGAGTGSYEPPGTVLAVEPSPTMITQRPRDAAPAVQAAAEALPVPDDTVDASLAVLTSHHWTDPAAGVAELVRVAPRQVVLTWDPSTFAREFWLVAEYLPEIAEREHDLACLDTVTSHLREHLDDIEITSVPLPAYCADGVLAAHWRRPEAYLDANVRAAASGLATLPPAVLDPALARLANDLDTGHWHDTHHDLAQREHLDVGYRLIRSTRCSPDRQLDHGSSRRTSTHTEPNPTDEKDCHG